MTEAEWFTCTDPIAMLDCLRGKVSDRKLRLFACACCRRNWHRLADKRSQKAVEIAEQYAEGQVGRDELVRAWSEAAAVIDQSKFAEAAWRVVEDEPQKAVRSLWRALPTSRANKDERKDQASLLRDIVGNPFRLRSVAPTVRTWKEALVVRLAQSIYEERLLPDGSLDKTQLAILADALEEAGCTNADILDHCRQPGVHVRGCWVVDLLLGKE